jgi:hypothetical protein
LVRRNSGKSAIREAANGIECGTKNHLFVFLKKKNSDYKNQFLTGKQFKNIVNGAVNSCGLKYD